MCVEPAKNKRLLKKAVKKFLKLKLHEGFAECSGMSWPRRAIKNLPKGGNIKVLLMVLLAVFLMAGNLFAQAAPQPAQGVNFGFAPGFDNCWLFSPGDKSGFFAVGAGIDIANYTQKLSKAKTGSTLVLNLHGTMLTPVTGNDKRPIFGAGINLDIMQLIYGTKIKILIDNLSVVAGPIAAYGTGLGKPVYGGLVNINFKF